MNNLENCERKFGRENIRRFNEFRVAAIALKKGYGRFKKLKDGRTFVVCRRGRKEEFNRLKKEILGGRK